MLYFTVRGGKLGDSSFPSGGRNILPTEKSMKSGNERGPYVPRTHTQSVIGFSLVIFSETSTPA
jgi:hypothetical protein